MMKRLAFALGFVLLAATAARAQATNPQFQTVTIGPLGGTLCKASNGSGVPNSSVVGSPCDLYLQTSGALWLKQSGTATNTGWVSISGGCSVDGAGNLTCTSTATGNSTFETAAISTVAASGAIVVTTGNSSNSSGSASSGPVTITTGQVNSASGPVGGLWITTNGGSAAIGGSTNGTPGPITIEPGFGSALILGGNLVVQAGIGGGWASTLPAAAGGTGTFGAGTGGSGSGGGNLGGAGGAATFFGGTGGTTDGSTNGTAGAGGSASFTGGTGGGITSGITAGAGGPATFAGGAGGNATAASGGARSGGNGADATFEGGPGGSPGTGGTGGNGGNAILKGGVPGSGGSQGIVKLIVGSGECDLTYGGGSQVAFSSGCNVGGSSGGIANGGLAANDVVCGTSTVAAGSCDTGTATYSSHTLNLGTSSTGAKAVVTVPSLGTSPTDAYKLTNPTAAAAGAQQDSPAVEWLGQGWKTNSTAASQSVGFEAFVAPVQGAANPTGAWHLQESVNGASYADAMQVDTAGDLFLASLTAGGIIKANGSGELLIATSGTDYAPAPTGSANTPLFNNGSGGFTNGTRSGNTTEVATVTGSPVSGNCAKWDANANVIDAGTTCGGSGTTALSSITLATGANTVANGTASGQVWNWALTSATADAFTFGETTANSGGANNDGSAILKVKTLSGSKSIPLYDDCRSATGASSPNCFRVDVAGTQTFTIDSGGHVAVAMAPVSTHTFNLTGTIGIVTGQGTICTDTNNGSEIGTCTNNNLAFMINDASPAMHIDTSKLIYGQNGWVFGTGSGSVSVSGCSLSGAVSGAQGGKFTSGTTGTCSVTISSLTTATNDWICLAQDVTHAVTFTQTATGTTSCTISASTTTSDVIVWWALWF